MLLSRDRAAFFFFSPLLIQTMPVLQPTARSNSTQTQLRLPPWLRPTALSRAPCRLLGLSRDNLRPLDFVVCKFSFTNHWSEISSTVLSKLNRYVNQKSVRRLEINEYKHMLCYKATISDVFGVRMHVLLAGFSLFVNRPMLWPHRTTISFLLRFL